MGLTLDQKVENDRLYKAFDFMAAKNLDAAETELNAGLGEAKGQNDPVLSALFYSTLGVLYKIRKDFQKAWKFYEQAEKLLPHDPALKLISARLLIDVFGQYEAATRRCQKVLELSKNDPPFYHQALATQGMAYLKGGRVNDAVGCLIESMDKDFEGLVTAANIDLRLVEALLRKKTAVPEGFAYLAKALEFAQGNGEDKFILLFQKLLESFPHDELEGEGPEPSL